MNWIVDETWYLAKYTDVRDARVDPNKHWTDHGRNEGRVPSPLFDPNWYRTEYGLPFSKMDPLRHYLIFGFKLGYSPCPHFHQSVIDFKTNLIASQDKGNYSMEELIAWNPYNVNSHHQSPLEFIVKSKHYEAFKKFHSDFDAVDNESKRLASLGLSGCPSTCSMVTKDLSILSSQYPTANSSVVTNEQMGFLLPTHEFRPNAVVVYLLPVAESFTQPFHEWLYSYTRTEAGVVHDLIIILKDILNEGPVKCETRALALFPELKTIPTLTRMLVHANEGMDIASYCQFTKESHMEYKWALFMSTYSIICTNGWLIKFDHALNDNSSVSLKNASSVQKRQVGLVGASGSYLKHPTLYLQLPLPNVHIRTNCFAARLEDMLACVSTFKYPIITKNDCFDVEHGPQSLTVQMGKICNMSAVVVDIHGESFLPQQWPTARIGFSSQQEGLIVSDKETENWRLSKFRQNCYLGSL
jgi:hypothetical protein